MAAKLCKHKRMLIFVEFLLGLVDWILLMRFFDGSLTEVIGDDFLNVSSCQIHKIINS